MFITHCYSMIRRVNHHFDCYHPIKKRCAVWMIDHVNGATGSDETWRYPAW